MPDIWDGKRCLMAYLIAKTWQRKILLHLKKGHKRWRSQTTFSAFSTPSSVAAVLVKDPIMSFVFFVHFFVCCCYPEKKTLHLLVVVVFFLLSTNKFQNLVHTCTRQGQARCGLGLARPKFSFIHRFLAMKKLLHPGLWLVFFCLKINLWPEKSLSGL